MSKKLKQLSTATLAVGMVIPSILPTVTPVSANEYNISEAEANDQLPPVKDGYTYISKVVKTETSKNTVTLTMELGEKLRFTFLDDNMFRMYMAPEGHDFQEYPTPNSPDHTATITSKSDDEFYVQNNITPDVSEVEDMGTVIKTASLTIEIDANTSMMTVKNSEGEVVIKETAPLQYKDGSTIQTLATDPSEYFFGGGTQNGRFSHKGELINIVNSNNWVDGGVASPNPFYWSTKGYGVIRNTWKPGAYDFRDENNITTTHNEKRFDAYFFVDSTPKDILGDYYELTGKPAELPEYASYLGHLNCYNRDYWKKVEEGTSGAVKLGDEWYVESQNDNGGEKESLNGSADYTAESIINEHKEYDMPLGWFLPNDGYGCGYGQESTQKGNLDNLEEFASNSIKKGVQTGLWTQSNLWPANPSDPQPNDRDIYKEVEAGVHSVKTDVAWVGPGYSMALNGIAVAYDAIESRSGLKPNIVTLDGWAGTQRYGGIWTGDQSGGQWEYIRFHIPTYIGTSLSGQPNVGSDMDGIFGGKNPVIWTRDFQWKSFTTYMLDMDGWGSNQKSPWAMGGDETSINRAYLKLKAQLMPYINTISHEATANGGLPMLRAMFLEESNPYTLGTATQYQYMWGDQFLVAPIYQETQMDEEGNDIRNDIYLPSTSDIWVDYLTGKQYRGGQVLNNFDAPLWKLPVFVKNGSIIPMYPENNNPEEITEYNVDGLDRTQRIVEFFPYGTSEFTAYEDDGKTLAGKGVTTRFTSVVEGDTATLTAEKTEGTYEGMKTERSNEFIVNVSQEPTAVKGNVQGEEVTFTKVDSLEAYNSATGNVYYYDEAPATIVEQFADEDSSYANMEEKTTPKLRVKSTEKVNINAYNFQVVVEGFANNQELGANTESQELQAPQNFAQGEVTSDSIQLTWDAVADAVSYDIMVDGTLYRNILDAEYVHEGLDFLTTHTYQVRSVNAAGEYSQFTNEITVTTADNPYRNIPTPEEITWTGSVYGNHNPELAFDQQFQTGDGGFHSGDGAIGKDLIIDYGKYYELDQLEYYPRDDVGNGTVTQMDIAISMDGVHWTELGTQTWAQNAEKKVVSFAYQDNGSTKNYRARYVKLTPRESVGGFFSASEIMIYKKDGTDGRLVGDVAKNGVIDEGDLTFYENYTGLKKSDGDWMYIEEANGDIDGNGLVDAYDFSYVASKVNGGISNPVQGVEGKIKLIPSKTDIKQGDQVTIDVYGIGLKNVNAFSVEMPVSSQFSASTAKASVMTAFMSNYSKSRTHSDNNVDNYVLFTNKGDQELLNGSGTLATITITANEDFVWDTLATKAVVVGQDLSSFDALIDESELPEAPETSKILSADEVSIQFNNATGDNISGDALFQQSNWKDLLFDGSTDGSMAEFKWDLESNPVPAECILPTEFVMDIANDGAARRIKKITINGRASSNGALKKSKLAYIDASGQRHELGESTSTSPSWEINDEVTSIIWTPMESVGTATTQPEGQKENRMLSLHEITIEEDAEVVATGIEFDENTVSEVKIGKLVEVSAKVSPDNVSNPFYTMESDNEAVLKVTQIPSSTGYKYLVQGVSEGTATITVKTMDGKFQAQKQIQVTAGADTDKLLQEVEKARALYGHLYTDESWAEVEKVLNEIEELLQGTPTQEQIDAATVNLLTAVRELEFKGSDDSKPTSENLIAQSGMTVVDETSHADQDVMGNVIDGNKDTIWHSSYQPGATLPQYFTVDLGKTYNLEQVDYLARQSSRNGHVTHYRIETSLDGETFVPAVEGYFESEDGALKDPTIAKEIKFDSVEARYVRFVAIEALGDTLNMYASCAEINFYGLEKDASSYADLQAKIEEVEGLVEETYTASTWAKLQEALVAAKAVEETAEESEIQTAINALEVAQEGLEKRANTTTMTLLSTKVDQAKALIEQGKTSEALETAVANAEAMLENPADVSEITAVQAITALTNAIAGLEDSDVETLKNNLSETIQGIKDTILAEEEAYVPSDIEALKQLITEAEALIAGEETTKEQLIAITNAIAEKVENMQKYVDKEALIQAVADAKAILNDGYTEESWNNLQDAIVLADTVIANEEATKEDVANALLALNQAVAGLVKEAELNTEALERAIALAEAILVDADQYISATIKDLPKALETAQQALENAKTQEELDKAAEALQKEIDKASRKAETSKLEEAIKKAETYDLSKYTVGSAQNVRAAIANAKNVLNDEFATQQQVDDAVKGIEHALESLVLDGGTQPTPDPEPTPGPNEEEQGSDQTDSGTKVPSTNAGANTGAEDHTSNFALLSLLSVGGFLAIFRKNKKEVSEE